jgi:hypothetical protein
MARSVQAARRLNRSSALLALSVLTDSGMEHYRGSFDNPAMFAPLVASGLSLLAGLHGNRDRRVTAHKQRDAVYLLAAGIGLAGTGFHLYNIGKRPGGISWPNLFYAAPIGAPAALSLSGLLGAAAERVRDSPLPDEPTMFGRPAGPLLAALVSAGLLGTIGEVGLLHFRGNFQNPAMYLPLLLPPTAAALLAREAWRPQPAQPSWLTRLWLRATAMLGLAGVGFHAYGISRHMGGWRNWTQNIFAGPPLPAPPGFTALALAGLAALELKEMKRD